MTIPCCAERSLWWCCLLGDAIGECAEQHQESAEGDGRERPAPDKQAPGPLTGSHLRTWDSCGMLQDADLSLTTV